MEICQRLRRTEMNTAQFNSVGISGSHIKNIIFKNNTASDNVVGFFVEDFFGGGIILENNDITRNNFGIRTVGQGVTVVNNNIYENHILGALVFPDSSVLEASGNWWGDASGPLNVTGNPDGLGNGASDWINFKPWLRAPFTVSPTKTPVLIIPGIAGTDLFDNGEFIWPDAFRMAGDINDNFLTEHLELNKIGDSMSNIETGEIVRLIDPGISAFELDVFNALINDLESKGYTFNTNYFTFPYDWRLDLDERKIKLQEQIESIKVTTGFQKVDIVAHSMGGLLTKAYLEQYGNESVNKLIFVGTPHLGAPKAAKVLLEGDSL